MLIGLCGFDVACYGQSFSGYLDSVGMVPLAGRGTESRMMNRMVPQHSPGAGDILAEGMSTHVARQKHWNKF